MTREPKKFKGNSISRAFRLGMLIGAVVSTPIAIKLQEADIQAHSYGAISENGIKSTRPFLSALTSKEILNDYDKLDYLEAIKAVQTPNGAQLFLDNYFSYDKSELTGSPLIRLSKGESFKENYQKRKGVCLDYATCAAALLSDDGYPPLLLQMGDKTSPIDHVVFLYKEGNKFGALGNTEMKPVYSSIEELVKHFYLYGVQFDEYAVFNLKDKFQNNEWINGKVNLQGIIVDKFTKINP
jgi:hypothetical protein